MGHYHWPFVQGDVVDVVVVVVIVVVVVFGGCEGEGGEEEEEEEEKGGGGGHGGGVLKVKGKVKKKGSGIGVLTKKEKNNTIVSP